MKKLFKMHMSIWEKKEMINRMIMTLVLSVFVVIMTEVLVRGDTFIEVYNDQGQSISCSDEYYVTLSPVEFVCTKSLEDGECICVKCSFDGGKSFEEIIKLPERDYVFYPRTMNDRVVISFFRMNIVSQECYPLGNFYIYTGISNSDSLSDFKCNKYKDINDTMYLNGEPPVLTVKRADGVKTFLSVIQDEEESVYEVESDLSVEFAQGEYVVKLYTMDVDGNINVCKNFPMHFIYDISPPQNLDIYIYGGYRRFNDNGKSLIISDKTLKVACDVQESLSGIESIIFYKNGTEIKNPMIELDKGFKGNISLKAIDRCGNESALVECNESFIIEDDPPVIAIRDTQKDDEIVLDIDIKDDTGILSTCVYIDGKEVDRKQNTQLNEEMKLSVSIPIKDIRANNCEIEISASDLALNSTNTIYDLEYLDKAAPLIRINGVINAKAYSSDVNINVSVVDDNIFDDEIKIISTYKNLEGEIQNRRYYPGEAIIFSQEGDYTINVSAIDNTGNISDVSKYFTIDKSAPIINGLDMFNGKYLPSFSLKGIINDMFIDESIVEYKLYLNGESFMPDAEITEEGHYNLKVIATDLAKNSAIKEAEFVIYNLNKDNSISGDEITKINNKSDIIISANNYAKSEKMTGITEEMDTKTESVRGVHEWLILLYLTIFSLIILIFAVFITIFRKRIGKGNAKKSQQRD